ncbi:MAG: hypothetical protein CL841_01365 [Crocinitomicaceae bacterium]|nr:hypothetical protein [Crocinitomicaceae bacterium]
MNYTKINLISVLIIIFFGSYQSQISQGGTPFSFTHNIDAKINEFLIDHPSSKEIEFAKIDEKETYKVGIIKPTNLSLLKNGTWINHANGSKSGFLKIRCKSALGLSLFFDNFSIPEGAEMFIYNSNKKHLIGKFNSTTNSNNILTHTQVVEGEVITIEYFEPSYASGNLKIDIHKVGYIFRGFEDYLEPFVEKSSTFVPKVAEFCQVDVACSPENVGWSEQIDAVVHFTYTDPNYIYVCSSSVINNTSQDCSPYILTAWHCDEQTANQNLNGYTWYWNYQKSSCQPNSNSSNPSKGNQTMINGTVKATSGSGTLNNPPSTNQVAGSDFTLIELNTNIPSTYNAYFAGWDRSNTLVSDGVGIHHPNGSAKKISTFNSNLSSTSYNGGAFNAHWEVYWDATINGHGVTEGGSSGSPIFNQDKRIVGQLSGGSSICSNPSVFSDEYGKFSTNWNSNGSTAGSQLEPWLDPMSLNITNLDGTYSPCGGNSLSCILAFNTDSISQGDQIDFFGASNSVTASYSWNFDVNGLGGVSPSTSNNQNPAGVVFNTAGVFDVQITVTSGQGVCTKDTLITVTSNTSTNNYEDYLKIVFPNPNKGIFNLKLSAQEFNKLGTGYIFNSIGEVVREIDLKSSNNILINLKKNSPGIYYLKFEKKPFISHKIIIID